MRRVRGKPNLTPIIIIAFVAFITGFAVRGFFITEPVSVNSASDSKTPDLGEITIQKIEAEAIIGMDDWGELASAPFTFPQTLKTETKPSPVVPTSKSLEKKKSKGKNAALSPEKPPTPPTPPETAKGRYTVQVGSFANPADAERLTRRLASKGYNAFVVSFKKDGTTWSRVRVGGYKTKNAAKRASDKLSSKEKLPTLIVSQ